MQNNYADLRFAQYLINLRSRLYALENKSTNPLPVEFVTKFFRCKPAGYSVRFLNQKSQNPYTCHCSSCPHCQARTIANLVSRINQVGSLRALNVIHIKRTNETFEDAVKEQTDIITDIKKEQRKARVGVPLIIYKPIIRRTVENSKPLWFSTTSFVFATDKELDSRSAILRTSDVSASCTLLQHVFEHTPIWASKEPEDFVQTVQKNMNRNTVNFLFRKTL